MNKILKLISGFILFIIGILIVYQANLYHLQDFLLVIGFVLAICGILLILNYFIDSYTDKTGKIIREVVDKSFDVRKESRFNDSDQKPLKVRSEFNDYDNQEEVDYGEEIDLNSSYFVASSDLDVSHEEIEEPESRFDNKLKFTPNYDKPLKITRKPKKRHNQVMDEAPLSFDYVDDKSDEIKKALEEDISFSEIPHQMPATEDSDVPREIKIDINNPESLPIPKSLQSYIVANDGIITVNDAFERLSERVTKEISLQIPNLNNLSDRVLSHIPTIHSRVIIEDFDVSDISYVILISSLIKQGVHIKTISKVNSINLIVDDSTALIVSDGSNIEYGALYSDRNGISQIRSTFDKTWALAKEIDENMILSYLNKGGV